jgi:hypothetical protein
VLTPWHIALARCLLQHKPPGMEVRGIPALIIVALADVYTDYILRLRQSLSTQQQPPATEYIDGVAYWKNLFQSSQFEILELQNKIAGLFMEVESLKSLGKSGRKRKAKDDLQPRRRSTRRKVAGPTLDPQQADHVTCMEWEDLSDNG